MKPYPLICIALYIITSTVQANIFEKTDAANYHYIVDFQLKEPNLHCILFGNIGCYITCAFIGTLYVQGGTGSCDKSFACNCELYQLVRLDDLASTKFVKNDAYVSLLNQIKLNPEAFKYTMQLLVLQPLLSGAEIKNRLTNQYPKFKEILKPLQPKQNGQLISEYVTNGKDYTMLINYIKKELANIPQDITDYLVKNYYKKRMENFKNTINDKATMELVLKQLKMVSGDSPFISQVIEDLEDHILFTGEEEEEEEEEEEDNDTKKEKKSDSKKEIIDIIAISVSKELISHSDNSIEVAKKNRQSARARKSIHKQDSKSAN